MLRTLLQGLPSWSLWLVASLALVGYLTCGLIWWYVMGFMNYGLNSGQLGRHPYLFPIECFLEHLPCYLPNGKEHRIKFIKSRVREGEGFMISLDSGKSWTNKEIIEKGSYEEVFYGMLGGPFYFWFYHLGNFLAWPVPVVLFLIIGACMVVIKVVAYPFQAWRDWQKRKYKPRTQA